MTCPNGSGEYCTDQTACAACANVVPLTDAECAALCDVLAFDDHDDEWTWDNPWAVRADSTTLWMVREVQEPASTR